MKRHKLLNINHLFLKSRVNLIKKFKDPTSWDAKYEIHDIEFLNWGLVIFVSYG